MKIKYLAIADAFILTFGGATYLWRSSESPSYACASEKTRHALANVIAMHMFPNDPDARQRINALVGFDAITFRHRNAENERIECDSTLILQDPEFSNWENRRTNFSFSRTPQAEQPGRFVYNIADFPAGTEQQIVPWVYLVRKLELPKEFSPISHWTVSPAPPTKIGECTLTTVAGKSNRLTPDPDGTSGSAVTFADGIYQVSYETVPEISLSTVGDQVKLCLVALPEIVHRGTSAEGSTAPSISDLE